MRGEGCDVPAQAKDPQKNKPMPTKSTLPLGPRADPKIHMHRSIEQSNRNGTHTLTCGTGERECP